MQLTDEMKKTFEGVYGVAQGRLSALAAVLAEIPEPPFSMSAHESKALVSLFPLDDKEGQKKHAVVVAALDRAIRTVGHRAVAGGIDWQAIANAQERQLYDLHEKLKQASAPASGWTQAQAVGIAELLDTLDIVDEQLECGAWKDMLAQYVASQLHEIERGHMPEATESIAEIVALFRTGRCLLGRPQVEKLIAAATDKPALQPLSIVQKNALVFARDHFRRVDDLVFASSVDEVLSRFPKPAPVEKTNEELAAGIQEYLTVTGYAAEDLAELVRRANGKAGV